MPSVIFVKCLHTSFAGAERGSRVLKGCLNSRYVWVRATEHTPRNAFNLLECIHGFAETAARGAGGRVEQHRVIPPYQERELMTFSESAPRHRRGLAQQ